MLAEFGCHSILSFLVPLPVDSLNHLGARTSTEPRWERAQLPAPDDCRLAGGGASFECARLPLRRRSLRCGRVEVFVGASGTTSLKLQLGNSATLPFCHSNSNSRRHCAPQGWLAGFTSSGHVAVRKFRYAPRDGRAPDEWHVEARRGSLQPPNGTDATFTFGRGSARALINLASARARRH